ncbi:MAG: curli assembly protein CsgF [Paracoccaceae bacterium]
MRRLAVMALMGVGICGPAHANELNFGFLNPNFGGDPFYGTFLLGMAQAQSTATVDPGPSSAGAGIVGGNGAPVVGPTIVIPIDPGSPDLGDTTVDQISDE